MATIEERATKYADTKAPCYSLCGRWTSCGRKCADWRNLYAECYEIATEQRAIDIEVACNVYRKHLEELRTSLNFVFDGDGDIIDIDKCVDNFRKEMTEQYG